MEKKNTGLGIACLVLGIIAFITCFVPYVNVISYILALIAIIFAIITFVNKQAKKGLAIGGIILSIIAIIIATFMNVFITKLIVDKVNEDNNIIEAIDDFEYKNTEELLKTDIKVTFGKFTSTTNEYGNVTNLPVTVKNTAKKAKTYSITIEAYDSSNNKIKTDYIFTNKLEPGESQELKAFDFLSNDEVEAMKTATFKIQNIYAY